MNEDVKNIQERNTRVEVDKAWEISLTRRAIIAIGTYVIIGGYLIYLQIERAWLHALVPVIAYIASTLTLRFFKGIWIKKVYSKMNFTTVNTDETQGHLEPKNSILIRIDISIFDILKMKFINLSTRYACASPVSPVV